jgi:SAM-dependent methyltransferase
VAEAEGPGTWHYGLVARWWAEFNEPEPGEIEYLADAIRIHGEPALDLGCGNGRLLLPLLAAGLDIDGVDVSEDMIALARAAATAIGATPTLEVQATRELDLRRRYGTIVMIGVFGLGGTREDDREGLRRAFAHLLPGGVLILNHELPYAGIDADRWAHWLAGHQGAFPRPWRETGDRRTAADGDELELIGRGVAFDPLRQENTIEMKARRWHAGAIAEDEVHRLRENLYFGQEIVELLDAAGFVDIQLESGYSGVPAGPDDGVVIYVARRPR